MTEKRFLKHPEFPKEEKKEIIGEDRGTSILTFRQQKIMNILNSSKILEMKDLQNAIKGVTERTLRRDLLQLQSIGLIKKIGNTKSVKYQLL
jgi:predicted DNA-binding transcriptional regulator YafY